MKYCAHILLLAMLTLGLSVTSQAEGVAVIIHKDNPASILSSAEINSIFRGKQTQWTDGGRIKPVNLLLGHEARNKFYESALNADVLDKFYLPGSPKPFKTVTRRTAESAMNHVARNKNAISYVPKAMVDESVKVVMLLD